MVAWRLQAPRPALGLARVSRYVASPSIGTRIAFETRRCASLASAQSLYTVEVHTPKRAATSRTESRRSGETASARRDCNSGVTRGGRNPAKSGEALPFALASSPVIAGTCDLSPTAAKSLARLSRRGCGVRVPSSEHGGTAAPSNPRHRLHVHLQVGLDPLRRPLAEEPCHEEQKPRPQRLG